MISPAPGKPTGNAQSTTVGTITRINDRTATIDPGDGTKWRVAFALLRHVIEV